MRIPRARDAGVRGLDYDRPVPAGARPLATVRPVDAILTAAFTAAAVGLTLGEDGIADSFTVAAVTLPLLWARSAPLAAAAAFAAGAVLSGLPTFDQTRCGVAIPVGLLIAYGAGLRLPLQLALAGLAATLAGLTVVLCTDPVVGPADLLIFAPLCAGVWGAGRLVRSHDVLARSLRAQTEELGRRREANAVLGVELDRLRLAAAVDAATRARVEGIVAAAEEGMGAPGDRAAAAARFGAIEEAGRAALDDVRALLGKLGTDAVTGGRRTR